MARGTNVARRWARGAPPLLALAVLGSLACTRQPYAPSTCPRADLGGCVLESVEILGNHAVESGEIKDRIATAETGHFLSGALDDVPLLSLWDRLTVDYERLDPFVLARDLARVERYYRSRGYYEAVVRAGRTIKLPNERVRVEIVVVEGEPVRLAKVDLAWKDWRLPEAAIVTGYVDEAKRGLAVGADFDEAKFEAAKKKLLRAMTDHGFAYATVDGKADVDIPRHQAAIVYTIELGPYCKLGPIKLEGNGDLPSKPLLAALKLHEGQEFSTAAIESAQIALSALGIFGAIDAVPELSPKEPRSALVPVTFRVTPTLLHTLRLGGGVAVGGRTEVRALIGWDNLNFFGGLRKLTIEARPGLVFYPTSLSSFTAPTQLLPEVRLRAELRQPAFIEPRTIGVINGSMNVYRLDTNDTVTNDAFIVGYFELAGRVGVERRFWNSQVNVGVYGVLQTDLPFSYKLGLDQKPAGFTSLTLPYLLATGTLDLRRGETGLLDPVNPHSGLYFSNELQIMTLGKAEAVIRDVRVRPELRLYAPIARHWTFAVRAVAGFLFPSGYGYDHLGTGNCANPANALACGSELQIMQFRSFFSGGSSSNRGYPASGVGPHELVTSPNQPSTPVATGGLTLWESSVELRAPVIGKLGAAFFVDGSNLSQKAGNFDFTAPHLSAGLGLRYETPIGPFRLDAGVRLPCAQVWGNCNAAPNATGALTMSAIGQAGTVLGLPLAASIAIGEAF